MAGQLLWSFIVLVFSTLLLVENTHQVQPFTPNYKPNQRYEYQFDTQIASSLTEGEQYSVSRVRTQLFIHVQDESDDAGQLALVTCESPQIAIAQRPLNNPNQLEQFGSLGKEAKIKEDMQKKLELPFQIRYNRGNITQIQFHAEDQVWSENLKRSIVNLLQVHAVPEAQQVPADVEEGAEAAEILDSDNSHKSFVNMETTVEGHCELVYTIIDDASGRANGWNATKSVNFNKCLSRPELKYNYARRSQDFSITNAIEDGRLNEATNKQAVDVSTVYEIQVGEPKNVAEAKNEFIVIRAQAISQLSHNLLDSEHISMVSYAVSRIKIKNVESKTSSNWPVLENPKEAETLMHSLKQDLLHEEFITAGSEAYLTSSSYVPTDNLADVGANIMARLVNSASATESRVGLNEESNRQFEHLVGVMRLAKPEQIQEMYQKMKTQVEGKIEKTWRFVEDIFIDALTIAGTTSSLKEFSTMVKSRKISEAKAAQSIQNLMQIRIASQQQLDIVSEICESDVAVASKSLRRSCWLTWGGMVNAMCSSGFNAGHPSFNVESDKSAIEQKRQQLPGYTDVKRDELCTKETKDRLIQKVLAIYTGATAENREDKILALKTIGNMGVDRSLKSLQKIIQDNTEDRIIRIQAIDALRLLSPGVRNKVQNLLFLIFQDREEHPEIRMNAFYQIVHCQPKADVMDAICAQMTKETNIHVKAFVQSTIKEMILSRSMFDQKTAKRLISSLQKLQVWNALDDSAETRSASQLHQSISFSPNYPSQLGSGIVWAALFGKDSHLPKELMLSTDSILDSLLMPSEEQYGLHQQDIEVLLEKIAMTFQNKEFDQVVVRGKRSSSTKPKGSTKYNPIAAIKSFFKKHSPFGRVNRDGSAKPQVLLYKRIHDLDVDFIVIDEQNIPSFIGDIIRNGKLDVSQFESARNATQQMYRYAATMNVDEKIKLPTIAGIPVIVSKRQPILCAVEGTAEFEFEPFGSEKVRGIKAAVHIQPQTVSTVVRSMEAFSPLFNTGVHTKATVQYRVPFDMKASIVVDEQKPLVDLEVRLPKVDGTLVHLSTRASTFQRDWPEKTSFYNERKEQTLYIPTLEDDHAERSWNFTEPMSGLVMEVRGNWPVNCGYENRNWMMAGENSMEFRVLPSKSDRPAGKLRFKVELSTKPSNIELEKEKLLKMFSVRKELFDNSNPTEQKMLKEFVQKYTPMMNEENHLRMQIEAEQSDKKRSCEFDVSAVCDHRWYICIVNADAGYKIGEEDQSVKLSAHIARPYLQGIYTGGVQSQHILAKVEAQVFNNDKQESESLGFLTANIYGKPSANRVGHWNSMLNIAPSEAEVIRLRSQIPTVLHANEYATVYEYQVPSETHNSMVRRLHSPYVIYAFPELSDHIQSQQLTNSNERIHGTAHHRLSFEDAHRPVPELAGVTSCMKMCVAGKCKHVCWLKNGNQTREFMEWTSENVQVSQNVGERASIVDYVAGDAQSQYAQCSMNNGRYLKSFDGQQYTIPINDCYTVLAKACGNTRSFLSSAFSLAAKKEPESGLIKLKMNIHEKIIQLYAAENQQMIVKVNDVQLSEDDYSANGILVINVDGQQNMLVIRCDSTGMEVRFDGKNVILRLTSQYASRMCGVCGRHNLDTDDDLAIGENGEQQAKSIRLFHAANLDDCTEEQISEVQSPKKGYKKKSWMSEREDNQYYFVKNDNARKEEKKRFRQQSSRNTVEEIARSDSVEKELKADDDFSDSKKEAVGERRKQQPKQKQNKLSSFETGVGNIEERSGNGRQRQSTGRNHSRKNSQEKNTKRVSYEQSSSEWKNEQEEDKNIPEWKDEGYSSGENQQGGDYNLRIEEPTPITIVTERRSSLCFSAKKIPQCPSGSKPTNLEWKTVSFVCLIREEFDAQQMFRDAKNGRPINPTAVAEPNNKIDVAIPENCVTL